MGCTEVKYCTYKLSPSTHSILDNGFVLRGIANVARCETASCTALIIAAQAVGTSKIYGVSKNRMISRVIDILRSLGVRVFVEEGCVSVEGVGIGGFSNPEGGIDVGHYTIIAVTMLGILSTHAFSSLFFNSNAHDASVEVSGLDFAEIYEAIRILKASGCSFIRSEAFPVMVEGSDCALPIEEKEVISSNVIKTALMLSSMNIAGKNCIYSDSSLSPTGETLLKHFGADISVVTRPNIDEITIMGQKELYAKTVVIPASSVGVLHLVAMALVLRGSAITITGVLLDKTTKSFLDILIRMGGRIRLSAQSSHLYKIDVGFSNMLGIEIQSQEIQRIFSYLPLICVVSVFAAGVTKFFGLSKLCESKRKILNALLIALDKFGIISKVTADHLEIHGRRDTLSEGCIIEVREEHKSVIPFLILGIASREEVFIKGMIDEQARNFLEIISKLAAKDNVCIDVV
ncbi:hypothetical protein O997_04655 [Anaplasma phagocytophilum str. MRK]|nr:hypothetical protein O997_04655 [Anaplasma phagocytophilum str. MRK]